MGQYCNLLGQSEPLYERLREELGDPLPPFMARHRPVTWETATCLSMCGGGPNLIVYPEEIVFNHLDADTLEQVIEDYVRPVE